MKKTVEQVDVTGKKVFVRVDFNVPLKDGVITDDTRIKATLPTIQYLLDHGAKVILASHLGRPKGEVKKEFSLEPCAKRLSELLGKPVAFASDCVGPEAKEKADALQEGEILLLENLRFHKEEEKNEPTFAKELASLADVAVNDAFGTSHRAHASVAGISEYIPMVAGYLLEKEIRFIGGAIEDPKRPFAAILGGAKVSDKIQVIAHLLPKVDLLIIGGGMANTFLAAKGYEMGTSLVEEDKISLAKELLEQAEEDNKKVLLPVDVVVAKEFSDEAPYKTVAADQIEEGWMALDIGSKTEEMYKEALSSMATIIWNGPMGVFEMEHFCHGTETVASAVAASEATSIVGGGDSVAAIKKVGLDDKISHISTGGGASLEYMEGKELPGIAHLTDY